MERHFSIVKLLRGCFRTTVRFHRMDFDFLALHKTRAGPGAPKRRFGEFGHFAGRQNSDRKQISAYAVA
jgi:hypothetical protein